jgi:hypothetical protein
VNGSDTNGEGPHTPAVEQLLAAMADWSPWMAWAGARAKAPRLPGVYLFRVDGCIVYCGMAGERAGRDGTRKPQGLWGRLSRYGSGKAATSGFGEAALDRALGDAAFIAARLEHLRSVGPERTVVWAIAAIDWLAPEVCWTVTESGATALALETKVRDRLLAGGVHLWGRR